MQEKKEHIKTRMLKTAARLWGYPETEPESSFDPLVSLLLSVCAVELEQVSGEIKASRGRVLERLVQLMSPEVLTGPLPAHALACALPLEDKVQLEKSTQFYTTIPIAAETENEDSKSKEIYFSPTTAFHLSRASIKFMATGRQLAGFSNSITREIITYAETGKELPASTLWIGIDNPLVDLNNTLFNFELRNESEKEIFYHQLPAAAWFCNNEQLAARAGYGKEQISGEKLDIESILMRDVDITKKWQRSVNALYKASFITLYDETGATAKKDNKSVPEEFINVFSAKSLQALDKEPLRWLCIKFPENIPNRVLQDVNCYINCFPVINTRLLQLGHRLQEIINIIPLNTEDLFFDLLEVTDQEGMQLHVRSYNKNIDNTENAAMLMRNSSVNRFDERDAASVIENVIQLLRDESSAFSVLGHDFISNEIKQLQQTINKLEQHLYSMNIQREQIPYLMISNKKEKQRNNLFVTYTSTNGEKGNNIKAGTTLQIYKAGMLDAASVKLVTTTRGGRNRLNPSDTVLAYKSALLSRDRIISAEDIKAYCRLKLGQKAVAVQIEKGVMIPPDTQQGFIKTLDITIEINRRSFLEMKEKDELNFWQKNLLQELTEKSPALIPYRVFLKEAV